MALIAIRNFPGVVKGVISPYPTVVMVTIIKYIESKY